VAIPRRHPIVTLVRVIIRGVPTLGKLVVPHLNLWLALLLLVRSEFSGWSLASFVQLGEITPKLGHLPARVVGLLRSLVFSKPTGYVAEVGWVGSVITLPRNVYIELA